MEMALVQAFAAVIERVQRNISARGKEEVSDQQNSFHM